MEETVDEHSGEREQFDMDIGRSAVGLVADEHFVDERDELEKEAAECIVSVVEDLRIEKVSEG